MSDKPKCWTCKYGWCTKQKSFFYHDKSSKPENEFEVVSEPDTQIKKRIVLEYRGLCFWRPQDTELMPPIEVNNVLECNHYVSNNTPPASKTK